MAAPKGGNSGRRNLIPNRPGERRGGRKPGSPNKLTVAKVENELRRIALSDPAHLFEKVRGTFTLKEISEMPADVRACIASVKVRTENLTSGDAKQDRTVEIRLWPKVPALELCARHFKWISDKDSATNFDVIDKLLDAWKDANRRRTD